MTIRAYQPSDKAQIIELLRLNTPHYFAPEEEKDLHDYLNNHVEYYYVVEAVNVIVGCGGINLSADAKIATIAWDIFHPEYQGKGLGKKLMEHRIQKVKEIKTVKILSVRTSQLAYQFYEKFDLKIKEIKKDYWAEGFDLYRLERELH